MLTTAMGVMTDVLAGAVALLFLLPLVSDLASLVLGLGRRRVAAPRGNQPRFIILVPAHNEARLIASCIQSLLALKYPASGRKIVVLADNCSDDTAARARELGAMVLERCDPQHPGKPRAVAWALPQLPLDRYDALAIVDADAVLDPDFAAAVAAHAPLNDKVVQPYEDVRNPGATAFTRMAAVLAAGRFRSAFPLKMRAGLNVPLSNGMVLGTSVLRRYGWQSFGLSEDCETYARLTAEGVSTEVEPGAHLYAEEAVDLKQASTQRNRWLAGRWQAIARVSGQLVRSRRVGWHQKLDVLAELAVPGPMVQGACVAALVLLLIAVRPAASAILAALLLLSLARPAAYAVLGLRYVRDPLAAARSFLSAPVYAAWRVIALLGTPRVLMRDAWIATREGR